MNSGLSPGAESKALGGLNRDLSDGGAWYDRRFVGERFLGGALNSDAVEVAPKRGAADMELRELV